MRDFVRYAAHKPSRKVAKPATPHNDDIDVVGIAVIDYLCGRIAGFNRRLGVLGAE